MVQNQLRNDRKSEVASGFLSFFKIWLDDVLLLFSPFQSGKSEFGKCYSLSAGAIL